MTVYWYQRLLISLLSVEDAEDRVARFTSLVRARDSSHITDPGE